MVKKIIIAFSAILLALVVLLLLPSNGYLKNALLHGNVNVDDYKIFENRQVRAGQPQNWEVGQKYNKVSIPQNYLGILKDLKTNAFVVIKDTAIVHESYFNGYSEQSYSNSFSVAKSIVGLLIGCAIDDSLIKNIDEPVANYIPEFNNNENKRLTIKELLTMSSGLNWDERYTSPFSVTTKAYYGNKLRELVTNCKVVKPSGKQFKYLSANTQLLALVVEKATGKHLAEYASEKLWKPLGASQAALWSIDHIDGVEKAYCCFNTNARDFARIGQLILNKGKWNGKQLISESYIEASTQPANWLIDEYGKNPLQYYGYQWWIMQFRGEKVVYARGILGQYIFVIPSKNLVIVRLGEKRCSLRTGNLPSDIYVWLNLGTFLAE